MKVLAMVLRALGLISFDRYLNLTKSKSGPNSRVRGKETIVAVVEGREKKTIST